MTRSAPLWLFVIACGGSGDDTAPDAPSDGFDRNAMLAHLATHVLLPIQTEFKTSAAALPGAIDAYCDAVEASSIGTTRDAAKTAWIAAVDRWQRAEPLLVGPAAMDNKTLRDRIYGWPLLATCSLDRDTASRFADPSSYDIAAKLVNARSLAAIEYLIYVDSPDHTCLQTPVGWDALGANLPRARCRLAEAIAIDVAAQAELLETAWRADGGNFVGELSTAGTSSSSIPSAQEGINRISDAMFYTDKMIKDMKLGETSGITINVCGTVGEPCLREVEHPISDRATFAIRANLVALREAFTGTAAVDGPGFDDFLIGVGHPEVAQSMTADLDAAIADANALPDSFLTALSTDYPQIVTTHAAVKQLTDDLKTQFLTLLNLEIPNDVATDND